MFCREQAVQVHRERKAIQAKGAELHLIGNGNPHQAEGFATTFGLTCPIWVDTSLDTFRALEMKQGFFATMGTPATWKAGLRAWGRGFRQEMTQGNAWQLGGCLWCDRKARSSTAIARPSRVTILRSPRSDRGTNRRWSHGNDATPGQ